MNFDSNNFQFGPDQLSVIEKTLECDGYVRIQFPADHLPTGHNQLKSFESFFVGIITKLGGECVSHNGDENSFVWHVRPLPSVSNDEPQLARSQTDHEFPFHTDCSYESNPPEYMALFVLEQDQLGGGQLEIIRTADILELLSAESKKILMTENFKINVPLEFRKSDHIDHINEPILFGNGEIRYRSDIVLDHKSQALDELDSIINKVPKYSPKLEKYTMIILNNRKYLHGRTKILDFRRHLLRIRFNKPLLYDVFSVYNKTKLRPEYLTFSNTFLDYFNNQHNHLYRALKSIVAQYSQPTELGAEIRRTFQFNPRIHHLLCELNANRPDFALGSYRPDILFAKGNSFKMNGKSNFEPKLCEINARFPLNAYLLSAAICSGDDQNQISVNFSTLLETIVSSSKFDTTKPMFILKSKEHGYDIHLFQQYWINKYHQQCHVIDPKQLQTIDGQLTDGNNGHLLEQFILELHQDEILQLSDNVFQVLIHNTKLRYINDLRTIFILHDKRLFSLLSNQPFLSALFNGEANTLTQLIPTTYVIGQMPKYVEEFVLTRKQDWCIKPNLAGKGENVTIGMDIPTDEWSRLLSDSTHQQWIVQHYNESIQYESMNLSGMLFCFNDRCFNIGMIRLSPNKIVNIASGGYYIRPYVHRQHVHCTDDGSVLTKTKLHEQLLWSRSMNRQWNKNVYLSSSGGSGGKRLFFATDIRENEQQRKILVEMMLSENVLTENDVCLNLFQANNMYRSFEIFNDFCSIANCTTLAMGADAKDEEILKIIEHFRPNILMGSPYRLLQLALFLEQQQPEGQEIKFDKILFACEPLDELKRDYFQRMFNCSIYLGFYGSAEAGVFACQTPQYSGTRFYMYPKELVKIEVFNSKILVTNLIRQRNQLIRFDTGDLGRSIPNVNNDNYGLIEIVQSERLILINSGCLSKSDIEECMNECDVIEWQLIIDQNLNKTNKKIQMIFRYVETSSTSIELLRTRVETYLKRCFSGSSCTFDNELKIEFEAIQYEKLIRNQTSNKLLKIIDKRL